jgi:hypothetical protein
MWYIASAIIMVAGLAVVTKIIKWHTNRVQVSRNVTRKSAYLLDLTQQYVRKRSFFWNTPADRWGPRDRNIIEPYVVQGGLPEDLLEANPELREMDREIRDLYQQVREVPGTAVEQEKMRHGNNVITKADKGIVTERMSLLERRMLGEEERAKLEKERVRQVLALMSEYRKYRDDPRGIFRKTPQPIDEIAVKYVLLGRLPREMMDRDDELDREYAQMDMELRRVFGLEEEKKRLQESLTSLAPPGSAGSSSSLSAPIRFR